jgi:hypothetical protein
MEQGQLGQSKTPRGNNVVRVTLLPIYTRTLAFAVDGQQVKPLDFILA